MPLPEQSSLKGSVERFLNDEILLCQLEDALVDDLWSDEQSSDSNLAGNLHVSISDFAKGFLSEDEFRRRLVEAIDP